jgi:CBS domain-containing protein
MDLAKNLRVESVSRLHPSSPLQAAPSATVGDAVTLLRRAGVGCLLVVEDGRLVGIFTERDLTQRILAVGKSFTEPLSECMTPNPVTVYAKDSIRSAVRKMEAGGYRHLPVMDERDRPVGLLSVKQIVHYLVEHFPQTVYNLPPDPGAAQPCREGA